MKNKIITLFIISLFLINLVSVFTYRDSMKVSNDTSESRYVINDKGYNKSLEIHQQQDNLVHNSGMNKIRNFINNLYNYLFNRNKFKITKEECRNKTISPNELGIIIELENDTQIEKVAFTKEVCEDIEFQSIEYDCVEKITTTTDSVCPDCVIWMDDKKNPYVDWIVNNESQILKREIICRKELSKRDLTKKWLDDNCLVYWCDLGNEEKEKYTYFDENFGNCDYFKSIYNEGWNKWKCGEDYFVEVNR